MQNALKLGSIILKSLERSHAISLSGRKLLPPNFNSRSSSVFEVLPDNLLTKEAVESLDKLNGKPLNEAIKILDEVDTSSQNSFLSSLSKLLNPRQFKASDLAKNELVKIYESQAKEAFLSGNTRRFSIRNDFVQKVKNGVFENKQVYENLFDENYQKLRMADYPLTSKFNMGIDKITAAETAQIAVKEQGGWHYRIPKNRHSFGWSQNDEVLGRISVNAETDSGLISRLDDLFGSGKIKGYYKTPSDSTKWLERHDPITIYLHETPNQNILDEIANAAKNSVRSTEDVLIGNKFHPGLALEKSPTTSDIENLIARASSVDDVLGNVIKSKMTKNGQLIASAGQISSAEKILELFSK